MARSLYFKQIEEDLTAINFYAVQTAATVQLHSWYVNNGDVTQLLHFEQ